MTFGTQHMATWRINRFFEDSAGAFPEATPIVRLHAVSGITLPVPFIWYCCSGLPDYWHRLRRTVTLDRGWHWGITRDDHEEGKRGWWRNEGSGATTLSWWLFGRGGFFFRGDNERGGGGRTAWPPIRRWDGFGGSEDNGMVDSGRIHDRKGPNKQMATGRWRCGALLAEVK